MLFANNQIRLLVTSKCNLNCPYCHNEGMIKESKFMKLDVLTILAKICKKNKIHPKKISISGGEPLLHPDILEIVQSVSILTEDVSLTTNGNLLSVQLAEKLKLAGLNRLRIGVDRIDGDFTRPDNRALRIFAFKSILEELRKLKITIGINAVISDFNINHLKELVSFFRTERIDANLFLEIPNSNILKNKKEYKCTHSKSEILKQILETDEMILPKKVDLHEDLDTEVEFPECKIMVCDWLCKKRLCSLSGTKIDPEGRVSCCYSFKNDDYILPPSVNAYECQLKEALVIGCQQNY